MKNKLVYSWYNSGQLYARGTHFFFAHPDVLQSFRSILNYDEAKFIINFGQQCRERIGEDLFISKFDIKSRPVEIIREAVPIS